MAGYTLEYATEKFWEAVDKRPSGCWIWRGAKHERGYGRVRWLGVVKAAHRVSWEIEHGQPVPDDKMALHSCDDPSCVNPAHLYLGTQRDNMRDRIERNRVTTATPRDLGQALDWIERHQREIEAKRHRIDRLREWIRAFPNASETGAQ